MTSFPAYTFASLTSVLWQPERGHSDCLEMSFLTWSPRATPAGRTASPAPPIIFKRISASAGMKRVLVDATDTMRLDGTCNFLPQNA